METAGEKKQKATSASSIDLLVSWGNEKPPSPASVLFLAKLSSPRGEFQAYYVRGSRQDIGMETVYTLCKSNDVEMTAISMLLCKTFAFLLLPVGAQGYTCQCVNEKLGKGSCGIDFFACAACAGAK